MKQKSKKIKWILCAICAFVFLTCSPLRAEASTGGKSADDAINWVKSQVGKGLDYDGVYGNQCVDLICYYYCIFRKNCASVPEERSAIPLQTEQSSAG